MIRRTDIVPVAGGIAAGALADARLPDPGQLSTVALAAVLGGMVGGAIARARRLSHDSVARFTQTGAFVAGWAAALIWLGLWLTP
ncbi:MAG TPA: hypothetical protein VLK58_25980 [Conexibacter sp.]|nr:hypothetical protein [Conexibacter sp.]